MVQIEKFMDRLQNWLAKCSNEDFSHVYNARASAFHVISFLAYLSIKNHRH